MKSTHKADEAILTRINSLSKDQSEIDQLQREYRRILLALRSSGKKIKIIVSAYNTPDGIGDAINMVGFYQILKRMCVNIPNVEIKGIAFINSEKLPNFQRAVSSKEMMNDIYYFNTQNRFDNENATRAGIIIISEPILFESKPFPLFKKIENLAHSLKKFCNECELFINIATQMTTETHPFDLLNPKCIVHSILELGCVVNRHLPNINGLHEMHHFHELCMGLGPECAGFKFDHDLLQLTEDKSKRMIKQNLKQLKTSYLGKKLFNVKDTADSILLTYFAKNRLAIGYLQVEAATHLAAEVFIKTGDQNKNIILICNASHVKTLLDQKTVLRDLFSTITLYVDDREEKISTGRNGFRELKIFDFNSINNSTKHTLSAMADMVLGSGDNSRMETVLCRLPFWQVLPWKRNEVNDLAETIKQEYPMVAKYLMLQVIALESKFSLNGIADKLIEFLKEYEDQLVVEWGLFRRRVIAENNVENHAADVLINCFVIHQLNKDENKPHLLMKYFNKFPDQMHNPSPGLVPRAHTYQLDDDNEKRVDFTDDVFTSDFTLFQSKLPSDSADDNAMSIQDQKPGKNKNK